MVLGVACGVDRGRCIKSTLAVNARERQGDHLRAKFDISEGVQRLGELLSRAMIQIREVVFPYRLSIIGDLSRMFINPNPPSSSSDLTFSRNQTAYVPHGRQRSFPPVALISSGAGAVTQLWNASSWFTRVHPADNDDQQILFHTPRQRESHAGFFSETTFNYKLNGNRTKLMYDS